MSEAASSSAGGRGGAAEFTAAMIEQVRRGLQEQLDDHRRRIRRLERYMPGEPRPAPRPAKRRRVTADVFDVDAFEADAFEIRSDGEPAFASTSAPTPANRPSTSAVMDRPRPAPKTAEEIEEDVEMVEGGREDEARPSGEGAGGGPENVGGEDREGAD